MSHDKNNVNGKFGFVILHYLAFDATAACVDSIFRCLGSDDLYEIVIVDNGSSNGTGNLLKERYAENSSVHVILLEENIGFAKGNNKGFRFAKEQLNCTFICMMNNDTILTQSTFIVKCREIYQEHPYAVIGPMIIRKDDSIQPLTKTIRSRKFYILYRNILKLELLISRIGIDTIKITEFILQLLGRKKEPDENTEADEYNNPRPNVRLHGCCWIFTPKFTEKFQGINDKTFLYREEELLYLLLRKNKLESFYTPELKIYHMEDVATDMIVNTPKKKREFIYRNEIASLKAVIDEMKE